MQGVSAWQHGYAAGDVVGVEAGSTAFSVIQVYAPLTGARSFDTYRKIGNRDVSLADICTRTW